jgi:uncharacterized protein YhbP (UPF0306 family)
MSADLVERIVAFLATHHVMSLASHGRDGPHAANLLYAHDGLALFWVSDPNARHSLEIDVEPRVAVTIAPDTSDFSEIRGLQLAGTAVRVETEGFRTWHMSQLAARYPFLKRQADVPPTLQAAYARAAVYRFEPSRVVLIDNTKGFGHKEALDLPAAGKS